MEKSSPPKTALLNTSRDVGAPLSAGGDVRHHDLEERTPQRISRTSVVRDPEHAVPSWRPSASLVPVEKYGRFEVLGRVGRGGMAEILLARERSIAGTTRHLVIKRILPEVADHDEMLHMFLDEARLVMGLSHPNLCQIFDVGENEGTWFIAMEWVHGITLHHLLRRAFATDQCDIAVMARIIAKCAEALHHAHTARDAEGRALNLVHRDVSPHNIMVAYDGRVKLLDFGIAKSSSSTHRTEAGVVKGKVCYMAPEQWLSSPLDGRTDVFALGACLYEALTGQVVFRRESQMDVMKAILQDGAPRLTEVAPHVPRALAAIVHRAIDPRPEARFQTALDMAEALELFLASLPEPVSAARVAVYTRELFRKEVQAGPVLERAVSGAELGMPPVVLPPPPALLLGHHRPRTSGPLPIPAPFATQIPMPESVEPPDLEVPRDALFDMDQFEPLESTHPFLMQNEESALLSLHDHVDALTPPRLPRLVPEPTTPQHAELEADPFLDVPTGTHARPLARTLGMPVVQSLRRIMITVLPAAAVLLVTLYGVDRMARRGESPALLPQKAPQPAAIQVTPEDVPPAPELPQEPAQASSPMAALPQARGEAPSDATESARVTLLSIDTQPWSTVYLGSRMLGTTPIHRVAVPDEPLTLRLVDEKGHVHERKLGRSSDPSREVFFELAAH